jgi:hypothetical protein
LAISAALGIRRYDYGISSRRTVTARQIGDIFKIIEPALKPLLVHCRAGADRAGLVAALYLFVEQGASAEDADRQLSIFYGHFPLFVELGGSNGSELLGFCSVLARTKPCRRPSSVLTRGTPKGRIGLGMELPINAVEANGSCCVVAAAGPF